jgi:hypothetical protein
MVTSTYRNCAETQRQVHVNVNRKCVLNMLSEFIRQILPCVETAGGETGFTLRYKWPAQAKWVTRIFGMTIAYLVATGIIRRPIRYDSTVRGADGSTTDGLT